MKGIHKLIGLRCSILLAINLLCVHGYTVENRPVKPEAGDSWIRNNNVRISLNISRESSMAWEIVGERWDVAGNAWVKTFSGSLAGDFRGTDAKSRRDQYHCYYPFQRVNEPNLPDLVVDNVKNTVEDGSACLTFRVGKNDLWSLSKIRILKDTSIVLFESVGQSHTDIAPHWTLSFSVDKPMLRLVSDTPGAPITPIEIEARNCEGTQVFTSSQRYCAAYRPGDNRFFVFLWPELKKKEPRRAQWIKVDGLGSVYLDAPFGLWAADMACDKDVHTIAHLAEGAHSQIRGIMPPQGK